MRRHSFPGGGVGNASSPKMMMKQQQQQQHHPVMLLKPLASNEFSFGEDQWDFPQGSSHDDDDFSTYSSPLQGEEDQQVEHVVQNAAGSTPDSSPSPLQRNQKRIVKNPGDLHSSFASLQESFTEEEEQEIVFEALNDKTTASSEKRGGEGASLPDLMATNPSEPQESNSASGNNRRRFNSWDPPPRKNSANNRSSKKKAAGVEKPPKRHVSDLTSASFSLEDSTVVDSLQAHHNHESAPALNNGASPSQKYIIQDQEPNAFQVTNNANQRWRVAGAAASLTSSSSGGGVSSSSSASFPSPAMSPTQHEDDEDEGHTKNIASTSAQQEQEHPLPTTTTTTLAAEEAAERMKLLTSSSLRGMRLAMETNQEPPEEQQQKTALLESPPPTPLARKNSTLESSRHQRVAPPQQPMRKASKTTFYGNLPKDIKKKAEATTPPRRPNLQDHFSAIKERSSHGEDGESGSGGPRRKTDESSTFTFGAASGSQTAAFFPYPTSSPGWYPVYHPATGPHFAAPQPQQPSAADPSQVNAASAAAGFYPPSAMPMMVPIAPYHPAVPFGYQGYLPMPHMVPPPPPPTAAAAAQQHHHAAGSGVEDTPPITNTRKSTSGPRDSQSSDEQSFVQPLQAPSAPWTMPGWMYPPPAMPYALPESGAYAYPPAYYPPAPMMYPMMYGAPPQGYYVPPNSTPAPAPLSENAPSTDPDEAASARQAMQNLASAMYPNHEGTPERISERWEAAAAASRSAAAAPSTGTSARPRPPVDESFDSNTETSAATSLTSDDPTQSLMYQQAQLSRPHLLAAGRKKSFLQRLLSPRTSTAHATGASSGGPDAVATRNNPSPPIAAAGGSLNPRRPSDDRGSRRSWRRFGRKSSKR